MQFKYLTLTEIIKLKRELMPKKPNTISNIISSEIKMNKNQGKGKILEINIRQTLKYYFNWKESELPRHFFYRKINFKNITYIICPTQNIESKHFYINFDEKDKSCYVIDKTSGKILFRVNDKDNSILKINNKYLYLEPPKEIEIDGLFQIDDFNLLDFNTEEIKIIFDNSEKINYKYCVIEVKYNKNKINQLIDQLKNDKEVIEHIIQGNILFLGFVNLNENEEDEAYVNVDSLGNLKCVIIGIRNEVLFGRNVTYPIDWKLIFEFKQFKKEFEKFKQEVKTNFQKIFDLLNEGSKRDKMISYLGKKTRRVNEYKE